MRLKLKLEVSLSWTFNFFRDIKRYLGILRDIWGRYLCLKRIGPKKHMSLKIPKNPLLSLESFVKREAIEQLGS